MKLSIPHLCGLDHEGLQQLFSNISKPMESAVERSLSAGDEDDLAAYDGYDAITFEEFLVYQRSACEQHDFDVIVSWLVPVVFAVMVVVGVVGNALVLLVVFAGRSNMRNTTNVLIANLAVSDLLFVTVCIPPTAVDYAGGWPFGAACCSAVQFLVHVTTLSSVYTLVLLSLDRFLAVVFPVTSMPLRTANKTGLAVATTWILASAAYAPVAAFAYDVTELNFSHGETRRVCMFDREHFNVGLYQTVFFAVSLALPLLVILGLYLVMLLRLWRGGASGAATSAAAAASRRTTARTGGSAGPVMCRRRVTRTIVTVIVAFCVCWTPLHVVLLLRSFNLYDISSNGGLVALQVVAHCLAYANSCLNPILYAFCSPNFRTAFVETCSRRRTSANGGQTANGRTRANEQLGRQSANPRANTCNNNNNGVVENDEDVELCEYKNVTPGKNASLSVLQGSRCQSLLAVCDPAGPPSCNRRAVSDTALANTNTPENVDVLLSQGAVHV